jgi:hypothetical protein
MVARVSIAIGSQFSITSSLFSWRMFSVLISQVLFSHFTTVFSISSSLVFYLICGMFLDSSPNRTLMAPIISFRDLIPDPEGSASSHDFISSTLHSFSPYVHRFSPVLSFSSSFLVLLGFLLFFP